MIIRRAITAGKLGIDVSALSPDGQPVRLSVSPHIESAATVGLEEICISDTLTTLGRSEKEAVIAHELAHVERRDVRDAEFICDDIAVRRIGDARAYVRTLMLFAMSYDSAAGVRTSLFIRRRLPEHRSRSTSNSVAKRADHA